MAEVPPTGLGGDMLSPICLIIGIQALAGCTNSKKKASRMANELKSWNDLELREQLETVS